MPPDVVFAKPTSVFVVGDDRPLLDWVAYAIGIRNDPEFIWTDVRNHGQNPSPNDPMARGVIPAGRLFVRHVTELALSPSPNVGVTGVIREDEPTENIRRLIDFLRLPAQTQHVLSIPRATGRPPVVILSNSHRVAALYPKLENVTSTVRTIVDTGASLIMTFADDPPDGRLAFDTIVHVRGRFDDGWKNATLTVEKGPAAGSFPPGLEVRLGDFAPLAAILRETLG